MNKVGLVEPVLVYFQGFVKLNLLFSLWFICLSIKLNS